MDKYLDVRNAGFDPPFLEWGGIPQLKVALEWGIVWIEGPESKNGFLVRPEAYPKNLDGTDYCQGIQSTSATHTAAFVQTIALPIGTRNLTLEAKVAYHAPSGGMAAQVGLDGTGQVTSIEADTVHWGPWLNQDGSPPWVAGQFCVAKAVLEEAESGYVSVWLKSQNKWRGRNNHVFWKEVSLRTAGDKPPDPASAAEKIMAAVDLLLEAVTEL